MLFYSEDQLHSLESILRQCERTDDSEGPSHTKRSSASVHKK